MPELRSGPTVLRPFDLADLPLVREAAADPYIPTITSVPPAYSDDEGRAFIERQFERSEGGDGFPFVIAAAAEPGRGIGSMGLWLREIESGRASIGYWLTPSARGERLAGWALRGVVAFAFETLAIPRLHLFVEPWNVASASGRPRRPDSCERPCCAAGSASTTASRDAFSYALLRQEWSEGAL